MSLSRQYVKFCDLRDFADPDMLRMIRAILPERDALRHVERKVWEFAMLALFLEETGRLNDDTRALSVGAGDERILFWLANRIGRVVATDVYGDGSFASSEASPSMLEDPRAHAPYPYREDHLEVMWMDGRALRFPDDSFDVVFSLSSIEHFGSPAEIARAAAEMGRVLKPGGHAVVVTDCMVRHHPFDLTTGLVARLVGDPLRGRPRGAVPMRRRILSEVFTPRDLRRMIVRPSGLRLVQPLEPAVSPESRRQVTATTLDGHPLPGPGGERYPMVTMRAGRSRFTSVCLAMRKP